MDISRRSPGRPDGQPDSGPPPLLELMLGPRLAIAAALAGVTVLCWLYLFAEAADMRAMGDMTMAMPPKGAVDLVLLLVMWWIMMIGMMLPSAAPMILTFATVNARRRARAQPWVPTALFAAGYVLAWGGFSIAATLAQWGLESAALVSPMAMSVTSTRLGGVLFLAAGLYQLTPLKHACLIACRSPFDFVINRWRHGAVGALRMGLEHGLSCLGCCWILMALLFVFGAMNLVWIAVLAIAVLVEKLLPFGEWTARIGGLLLMGWGLWLLAAG
jgi:predicted metal-binding membrane protein